MQNTDTSNASAGLHAGALAGLKVLDISNFLAAPLSTMFLADFGAEVIKVERPGRGDELRMWGDNKDGVGLYFKVVNRNKQSVELDLHTPLGVEAVKKLVAEMDVVVENYRPGTLEKWGLGYDVLSAINPRLILVRVTGFGQTGPYSPRPGFGTLAEAMAGYVNISGTPDQPPLLPGFGLADASTGLMAAFLTLAAVHEQRRTGRGQVVDLAIYETLLTLIGPHVVNYDQLGKVQQRAGSRLPFVAPRNIYPTRDGHYVSIAGSSQGVFERICAALEAPQIARDPRYLDNRLRLQNAEALDEDLMAAMAHFDRDDLLARFERAEAAIFPVYDVAEIFEDPQVRARENIVGVPDEQLGDIRMQNVVGKLSRTPGAIRHAGPPTGQSNREILIERLGFTEAQLAAEGIRIDLPAEA
ncbi:CoA transferase [Xylophilus rhododendri]|uniref:CoA transferase n=2 Tax=Xylophilus rhododendri TaxID=2697032 RepID=A0A857J292_9BURK|nr:CoA transferase [Xylophilus rhododendri]